MQKNSSPKSIPFYYMASKCIYHGSNRVISKKDHAQFLTKMWVCKNSSFLAQQPEEHISLQFFIIFVISAFFNGPLIYKLNKSLKPLKFFIEIRYEEVIRFTSMINFC